MVSMTLGKHKILMGAEIDAYDSSEGHTPTQAELGEYVEIKSYK